MQNVLRISLALLITAAVAGCGNPGKEKGDLGKMKTKLEKLKSDKNKLDEDIRQLEQQIAKIDPNAVNVAKLVSVDTVSQKDFEHFIELQGKIDADDIAYVAPNGQGGVVKEVYVKLGNKVGKGQVILRLDDVLARQNMIAAQQNVDVLKARYEQVRTIYDRTQNLWKQNIGSEIQVINAKADMDALKSQLNAAEAQLGSAQEAVDQTRVRAEISGVVDEMNVKPGEFFSPQTAAQPGMGIRIVNSSRLKMVTGVPENYIARVRKGDSVQVVVPETGKPAYRTVISIVGASISSSTRSFITEAKLPSDPLLKPNQTASMKILDYKAKNAIVVPVNVVQTDEKGKYVYVVETSADKKIARKKAVTVGEVYGGQVEIKEGVNHGDLIITEGYQSVYDGQAITTGI